MENSIIIYGNEFYHWGIKGQKWGTRRYQNEDGSLTPEGYEHYGYNKNHKLTRGDKIKIRNMRAKEIKSEFRTHGSKAKELSKNRSYAEASREYEKSAKIKARLANMLTIAYPVIAYSASKSLAKKVSSGQMDKSAAETIAKYSFLGKTALGIGLRVSSAKDSQRSSKEYFKSYGYGR